MFDWLPEINVFVLLAGLWLIKVLVLYFTEDQSGTETGTESGRTLVDDDGGSYDPFEDALPFDQFDHHDDGTLDYSDPVDRDILNND